MATSLPRTLSPKGLVAGVADYLISAANSKHRRAVKERIAHIVTAEDPQDVQALIEAIQHQAAKDASFARLLDRSGILGAKEYGREIVPQD